MATMLMVGGSIDDWGLILSFLDFDDERGAVEQFNEKYVGGWNDFEGFVLDADKGTITYPGDPPYEVISTVLFRKEVIALFPSGWVLVAQPDKSWRVARMD